jgi:hypothetical protein
LRNPLREICTAGSVRGELPSEPRWPYSGTKLETADTAKESLQLLGLLYSEKWARARGEVGQPTVGFSLILSISVYVILDLEYLRLGVIRVNAFNHYLPDVRNSTK